VIQKELQNPTITFINIKTITTDMNLRELKKEVHALQNISETVKDFQNNWIKPLRANTNKDMPFLQNISPEDKKELNQKISKVQKNINELKYSQIINDKLGSYARYLIELKLTTLNGDMNKSIIITNSLLNDDFLNLRGTISDIKSFDENVKELSDQYKEINLLLQKKLSLDEILFFMDLPHKKYLYHLLEVSKKQKHLVRHIGRHFISLAKQTRLKDGR